MPLTPFPVNEFGGLRLDVAATELGTGNAAACSNVSFEKPGQLPTRPGSAVRATTATAPQRVHLFSDITASLDQVITSSATKLEAFTLSTGASVASVATTTGPHSMVTFGAAATPVTYTVALGDGVRKWSGAAWSTVLAGKDGSAVTSANASDRLVLAGDGTTKSRVWFSDPGAPETVGANNFVDITPGDGERIFNAISWQNFVFVFKKSLFAVFTGESTLSDGSPVFNYRIERGVGTIQGPGTVCVAPHGVYFLSPDGIRLTTGGPPVLVSQPLAPLFGTTSSAMSLSTNCHLAWHRGRLYVVLRDVTGTTRMFVYYQAADSWAEWDLQSGKLGGGLVGNPTSNTVQFVNGTDLTLYSLGPAWTTDGGSFTLDNGSAIAWSYTTGYSSAGGYYRQRIVSSGERKRHHHVDILGSGTVTHQVLTLNSRTADIADPGGSVTLGTAPALARGYRRRGARGTHLAHKLSGSGPAVISGMTYWLANVGSDT